MKPNASIMSFLVSKSRRCLLFLLVLCLNTTTLSSKTRNVEDAWMLAHAFFSKKASPQKGQQLRLKAAKQYDANLSKVSDSTSQVDPYYIFNNGEAAGYVIISGDDRVADILGYADTGRVEIDRMPPSMKYWLDKYATEIKLLSEEGSSTHKTSLTIPE